VSGGFCAWLYPREVQESAPSSRFVCDPQAVD